MTHIRNIVDGHPARHTRVFYRRIAHDADARPLLRKQTQRPRLGQHAAIFLTGCWKRPPASCSKPVKRSSFPDSNVSRFTFHISRTTRTAFFNILQDCSLVVPHVRTVEVLACQNSFSAAYYGFTVEWSGTDGPGREDVCLLMDATRNARRS